MGRPVLELEQLRLRYPGSDTWTLDGLNLNLEPGETLALVGSSGCGKSTVARAVMQLLPQGTLCEGRLALTGQDPRQLRRPQLRQLRGKAVGLVFQDPMTRMNPLMSVGGHLIDTLKAHRPQTSTAGHRERARELLERVGIGANRFRAYPHELSGGMRQRLAIALAIALEPPLLIADEPTTSLDVAVAGQVMAELSGLCQELGSALLLISHDLAMAARWCGRMAMLDGGRKVEDGPSHQLLTRPQSSVGQRLVASAQAREGGRSPARPDNSNVLRVEEMRCWHAVGGAPWAPLWLKAVDGVSFELRAGESLGVVGASGCGKSTLCRALMGLNPIRGGRVDLLGQDLLNLRGEALRTARRALQMVFQDPLACLNPALSVADAIADPLLIHGLCSKASARQRARELMERVGLNPAEQFQDRLPRQLSGGQQQRLCIARAIAVSPEVILMDEPCSALDPIATARIEELIEELSQNFTIAIVTHNMQQAARVSHRTAYFHLGKLIEVNPTEQVFTMPEHNLTESYITGRFG